MDGKEQDNVAEGGGGCVRVYVWMYVIVGVGVHVL